MTINIDDASWGAESEYKLLLKKGAAQCVLARSCVDVVVVWVWALALC